MIKSSIVLVETGECLKEDTELRLKSMVNFLLRQIPPNKQSYAAKVIAWDMAKLVERIRGES
jgi:hypothetical protein